MQWKTSCVRTNAQIGGRDGQSLEAVLGVARIHIVRDSPVEEPQVLQGQEQDIQTDEDHSRNRDTGGISNVVAWDPDRLRKRLGYKAA